MANSQDMAFLRHAVGAGYMNESVATICQRALETSLANGRQVTVAELAVELGMIDAANARRSLDAVRGAPEPTTRLSAVLPLPSSAPGPFGSTPGPAPAPFVMPRASGNFRLPPPAPAPMPAPPAKPKEDDSDIGGRTLVLGPGTVPLPIPGALDDESPALGGQTLRIGPGTVLPIPPAGTIDDDPAPETPPASHPDQLSDSDLAELASVTLTGDLETIAIPRNASGGFDAPPPKRPPPKAAAPAGATVPSAAAAAASEAVKAELAKVMAEAAKSTEGEAVAQAKAPDAPKQGTVMFSGVIRTPKPAGATSGARPLAQRKASKGAGALYLTGAIGITVGLVAFVAINKNDDGTKTVLGVPVATTTEPAPDRIPPPPVGVVPSQPPPPPPPLADPEGVLVVYEEKVQQFLATGAFADARALQGTLPPDVIADSKRKDRVEAAVRSVDEAHRLKLDRERRALSDMLNDGDVAGARTRARAASSWALDDWADRLAREVEDTVRKRHEPLATLPSAKLVEVEKLETLVRGMLSDGTDTTFFPNGGVALDYGQAYAALATDLRVVSPEHAAGVHLDLSRGSLLVVHRLPIAQVLDVSIDFQILRALTEPKACVALLIGVQSEGEQVGIGTSWDGEPVELTRSKGLIRKTPEADKPPTPGSPQRLRLEVTPGPNQGITIASTIKDLRDGIQRGGQPMPWPQRRGSRGFVAIFVKGADIAVSSFRVRALADVEAIKQ